MSDSCNPMNCSLPGSSARGILQARILEWVVIFLHNAVEGSVIWSCIKSLPYQASTGINLPFMLGPTVENHTSVKDLVMASLALWSLVGSYCPVGYLLWRAGSVYISFIISLCAWHTKGPPKITHIVDTLAIPALFQYRKDIMHFFVLNNKLL